MKKNNKNAFTLVELLAVIVILAIILVIAVPKVMSVIEDSKKATFESTAKMIASAAEKAKVQNAVLGKNENISCSNVAKINDVDYETCSIEFDENQALITMSGSGKFDGYYVCYGTKTGASVQEEPCGGTETAATCFDYEIVYDVKPGDKTSCVNYTKDTIIGYGFTEDDVNTFCEGNIVDSYTFSQLINRMIYEEKTTIEQLKSNNVVTNVQEVAEITGYDSTCGEAVSIPRKIDDKLVYGIGNNAFQGTTITSVKLPTSLRYIGNGAFISTESTDAYGTTDPYASTNPYEDTYASTGSVQITGELDLSKLTKLQTIGSRAFVSNQITSVKFPSSLIAIGDRAFSNNQISGVLDLSNTKLMLETLGSAAFEGNAITSIKYPLSYVDFAADSWTTIVSNVKSGNYLYKVGDTKTVDMGSLGVHTIRVANTTKCSEVSVQSQTACGFVLEFADIITTYNMNPAGEYNGTQYDYGTNLGGWPASAMRKYLNDIDTTSEEDGVIYNALPEELRAGIINTYVVSSHGSNTTAGNLENENAGVLESSNYWSNDKLYLLSPQEVYGTSFTDQYDSSNGTSRQLDYYANNNVSTSNYSGAIKNNGESVSWLWLRSARSDTGNVFYGVANTGKLGFVSASGSKGVSPAFRLAN